MSTLEGFLKKLGEKGPRKSFKKRWFVLKDDSKIFYYASKSDTTEKGFIDLNGAILVTVTDQSKKLFQINTPRRIYYLQADTQEAMDYWVNGVNDIMNSLGNKADVERLSGLLEQSSNRVSDLETQLNKLRSALDFACAELGTDREALIRRLDQGEKPKSPSSSPSSSNKSDDSSSSAASTSSPAAAATAPAASSSAADSAADSSDKPVKTTFGAQVLYDYNARKDYELTIHVNEIITVLSQHENGWWLGCNHAGKQGYFPGSYVRALT